MNNHMLLKVKRVGAPPRTGREEQTPFQRGEEQKAHTAELRRVLRVVSMIQRDIHNAGQVEFLFFNVTLTMSQGEKRWDRELFWFENNILKVYQYLGCKHNLFMIQGASVASNIEREGGMKRSSTGLRRPQSVIKQIFRRWPTGQRKGDHKVIIQVKFSEWSPLKCSGEVGIH